jgi:hypothetical protein
MKRSSFRRPAYEPAPAAPLQPLRRAPNYARTTVSLPVPKSQPLQHQGYINLVRDLPCAHCARPSIKPYRSQFCHSDEGKGTGIKSDCRLGWPGCPPCHFAIGTERIYGKQLRRLMEAEYAKRTRAAILGAGLWPKRLPLWGEA